MSFLRIEALWALPLVLLPILIHLIHRRKHPTIPWAAMMFVGHAARASRGGAKLRRWLILAIRTAVIAAILLATARPLSSGMFGLAAGKVAATSPSIVVIDRSPSMQRRDSSGETRQVSGTRKIAATLQTLGVRQTLAIDSVAAKIRPLDHFDALTATMSLRGADSTADLPTLLRSVVRHLEEQDQRVADVWVCSDRQSGDWEVKSEIWEEINDASERLGTGVRFHLSDFQSSGKDNSSVTVTRQRRISTSRGDELALAIEIASDGAGSRTVPVEINVNGVTTVAEVEVTDGLGELSDYRLKIDRDIASVSGHVAIPADVNASDDRWYFSIPASSSRPIGLVTEADCLALEAAAEVLGVVIKAKDANPTATSLLDSFKGDGGLMSSIACLIWQGAFPEGEVAAEIESFVERGGSVVFFPPQSTDDGPVFREVRWGDWTRARMMQASFDGWQFQVAARCAIDGKVLRRATVEDEQVFAGKTRFGEGTMVFCGANVDDDDSLFVKDGLALFALLSESLDASQLYQSDNDGMTAGGETEVAVARDAETSGRIRLDSAASEESGSLEFGHHAGLLSIESTSDGAERIIAINRDPSESTSGQVPKSQLSSVAPSVSWNYVPVGEAVAPSRDGFVREIWGAIWILVVLGMLFEAFLTLPRRAGGSDR